MTAELELEPIASETEDAKSSVAQYRIRSYPADYTLWVLYEKWQNGDLIVPKFQRGFVWTQQQASRLIESFLMGLPVPSVFLYTEPSERHLIVDGHQRLKSIFSYFDGKWPDSKRLFSLKGVNDQWQGKSYDELDDAEQRRLQNSVLRSVIMEQIDPRDMTSVYHVFERLNTGGTSLKPQEVRNCVYHGPFNDFILLLNKDALWRRILGSPTPDKRMRDVELIVRFLALWEGHDNYKKSMKDFLGNFMGKRQRSEDQAQDQARFGEVFHRTVYSVVETLGDRPFHVRRGLQAAVFDSVMVAFAISRNPPENIQTRYHEKLLSHEQYQYDTTAHTTDEDRVKDRIRIAQEVLFG